jgi:hypothetical protein
MCHWLRQCFVRPLAAKPPRFKNLGYPLAIHLDSILTMRFVVDTNQIESIAKSEISQQSRLILIISPWIWHEFILQQRLMHCLTALAQYNLAFGMHYSHIIDRLCCLNENEIREFEPIYPVDSEPHFILRGVFNSPSPEHFQYAKKLYHDAQDDKKKWLSWLEERKKEYRDAISRGENIKAAEFSSIEEVDSYFISGENAKWRQMLIRDITDRYKNIRASSVNSLYNAVLENPCMHRFFRLHVTFVVAYADSWSTKIKNSIGDLQANRNDAPDLMLGLYAADGDTILTNDKRFQRAFRFCDPLEKVRLSTWIKEKQ